MLKRCCAVVALSVLLAACATQQEGGAAGERYGETKNLFRGRWWSYYERGTASLGVDSINLAEQDLKSAIAGRSRDSWSARTYGLHFVEYFPNRELGVTYFKLGRLDDAEKFLKTSIEQVDTERAHYYLDQITKARIAKGEITDATAPNAGLGGDKGTLFASRNIDLAVQATDDVGVAEVRLNGDVLPQRASLKDVKLAQNLTLNEGTHEFQVQTKDLSDKESTQTVSVTIDMTAPTLAVFEPAPNLVTQADSIKLRGAAVDAHGVTSIKLIDGDVPLAEAATGKDRLDFERDLPIKDGENKFVLIAFDAAGNEIRSAVKVFRGAPKSPSAKLWKVYQTNPEWLQMASTVSPGSPAFWSALDSVLKAQAEAAAAISIEMASPEVETGKKLNASDVLVKGTVTSQAALEILVVQGQKVDIVPDTTAAGQPVQQAFNRKVPVEMGTNIIDVAAKDSGGNATSKRLSVEVEYAGSDPIELFLPVAILPINEDLPVGQSLQLRGNLEKQLGDTKRFRLVDRAAIDKLLQEQVLSASGVVDPATALKIGGVVAAQLLLNGTIADFGQELTVRLNLIRTETGDILQTFDSQIKDRSSPAEVDAAMNRLAVSVRDKFPKLAGLVQIVKGEEIITNLPADKGVFLGMPVLVLKVEPPEKDPVTDQIIVDGVKIPIARGVITQTSANGSRAKKTWVETGVELANGMPTVTW